jgi:hypothetical protein
MDADIRRALRERLTIRRRVIVDQHWISAAHHEHLPIEERPRPPEWIDETPADADTMRWAVAQLAHLTTPTSDDFQFVREYFSYALDALGVDASLRAEYLETLRDLEHARLVARIAAHIEHARAGVVPIYPVITGDDPSDTARLGPVRFDGVEFARAMQLFGVLEAEATARVDALRADQARARAWRCPWSTTGAPTR